MDPEKMSTLSQETESTQVDRVAITEQYEKWNNLISKAEEVEYELKQEMRDILHPLTEGDVTSKDLYQAGMDLMYLIHDNRYRGNVAVETLYNDIRDGLVGLGMSANAQMTEEG